MYGFDTSSLHRTVKWNVCGTGTNDQNSPGIHASVSGATGESGNPGFAACFQVSPVFINPAENSAGFERVFLWGVTRWVVPSYEHGV
jgi:hypothetical protein